MSINELPGESKGQSTNEIEPYTFDEQLVGEDWINGLIALCGEADTGSDSYSANVNFKFDKATSSGTNFPTFMSSASSENPEELDCAQACDQTISAAGTKSNLREKRDIILFNRKLRNRDSAKRSRAKKELALRELIAQKSALELQLSTQGVLITRLQAENAVLKASLQASRTRS